MIKVTLKNLIDFSNCYSIFEEVELPIKVAFTFEKIKNAAEKEFPFYQEKFSKILDKYAVFEENGKFKFTEDGQGIVIKEDKIDNFNSEMKELDSIEIEIACDKFKINDFEKVNIKLELMSILMPFVED